jgi:tetratricopeptide (TPR) repeat protein
LSDGNGGKAIVVTYPDEFDKAEILELAKAAGYEVKDVMTQKDIIRSEYGVGVGKAQELQGMVEENGSDTIIFDASVTSSQANKLAALTHAEVVDRERLILNIFSRRANTTEAKLQVKLAELRYELGWAFAMSGQFDRAIPNFYKALELDQNHLWARLFLGYAYLFAGKTNEALQEFQVAKQRAPDDPWALGMLGWAYGITGHRAEATQVQADLDQLSRKRYVLCYLQAYVCMGLGQKNATLDWLEKACEKRDGNMPTLNVDRVFDPIRNEPRFQVLLKKVGFGK